jgi:hypothetical protein
MRSRGEAEAKVMDRDSRQRIWKLERLLSKAERLLPAVVTKTKLEESQLSLNETFRVLRESIRYHTTAVAAIVLSGEPKIDEPLVHAWDRTLSHYRIDAHEVTRRYEAEISKPYHLQDLPDDYDPEDPTRSEFRAAAQKMYPAIVEDPDYERPGYWWNPSIVHASESLRFTEIFSTAPGWLLEFTRMRLDAQALEFHLPDRSAELIWGVDGIKDAKRWPLLPLGTMAAGGPVCIAPESDLSPEEQRFYQEMKARPEEEWSRFDRRRMHALIERLSPKNS